jgi:hypothetical protein
MGFRRWKKPAQNVFKTAISNRRWIGASMTRTPTVLTPRSNYSWKPTLLTPYWKRSGSNTHWISIFEHQLGTCCPAWTLQKRSFLAAKEQTVEHSNNPSGDGEENPLGKKSPFHCSHKNNFGRDKTLPLSLLKQQLAKIMFITMMAGSGDPSLQQPTAKQQQANNSQQQQHPSQQPAANNSQQPAANNPQQAAASSQQLPTASSQQLPRNGSHQSDQCSAY